MVQRATTQASSEQTAARPKRVPVGARNVLVVKNQEPGYVYRWVNDLDDRISIFKEGGWEVVTEPTQVGDKRVGDSSQLGNAVSKAVGQGITSVLMRIREEWYNEDAQAQLVRVRRVQDEIMQEARARGLMNGNIKIEKS